MTKHYPDKYQLTLDQNIFLAKKRLVSQVYHISRFENCKTTLLQTEKILQNRNDIGVSPDDIGVIIALKRGFDYIFYGLKNNPSNQICFDLALMKKINSIVAIYDALDAGNLRTGKVGVTLYNGERHEPNPMNENQINEFLLNIDNDISHTHKAILIMLFMMRNQLFWDGNKRTAILFANSIMINYGCGLIEIDEYNFDEFNMKLSNFYQSGNSDELLDFIYHHCIFGMTV